MIEEGLVARVGADIAALADLDTSTLSLAEVEQLIRATQVWTETLAGAHSRMVDEFEQRSGPQLAGCSTTGAWLRRELRLSAAHARRRRRAGAALRVLPLVAAALAAGRIRSEHVDVFADATRRIGVPTVQRAQQTLLEVAEHGDLRDLRVVVDRLRDATDPDAAERDWVHAQEKQDITCHRVGVGYQVNGWLPPETGAKLRHLLDSFGRPAHGDDTCPVAKRRVEGLDALLDSILAGGLPTDHGIRPHLVVTVDAATLAQAADVRDHDATRSAPAAESAHAPPHSPTPAPTPPATLAGYGSISRDLLARLACDSLLTVVLTDGHTDQHRHTSCASSAGGGGGGGDPGADPGPDAGWRDPPVHDPPGEQQPGPGHACGCPITPYRHVLDVGRTERIATPKQRLAVLLAQDFRCATPGCDHTHLQIHHIVPWLLGGPTDMRNLIGLCTSCHTLLHRGQLICTADGHGGAVFHTSDGTPIPDIRRQHMRLFDEHLDTRPRGQDQDGADDAA